MYVVWAGGVKQSIPLPLDEAKEFAIETGMDFEVREVETLELVWSASEYEFSRYYVEVECDYPVWQEDCIAES